VPPLPPEWKEEVERLRAERDEAQRAHRELLRSIDQLTGTVAKQNDKLDQLFSMLRRREAQLARAEREVRRLRRNLGLDDPDPEPHPDPVAEAVPGEGEATASVAAAATEPDQKPQGGTETENTATGGALAEPKPRPRSRGGRRPPPDHLPADTEKHEVCACAECGGRVFKRDVLITSVYTVVPTYVRRRLIRRERAICADPECNVATTATMPPMPSERALYDCRFLAWLIVMKFVLLVPLDRVRLLLLSQGVDIAMGTLVHLVERAADLVDPVDGEHMKQLRASACMRFDGTGLKALVLGQPKAWDGYLEVFVRDELTVFQFDLTKHADRLRRRIRDFVGILMCDAETRNAAGAQGVQIANCNAHPRRALRDAERVQPRLAVQGGRFIQALYELEDEAEEAELTGADRVAFRRRRSRRVLRRFRQWLEGVRARPLPPSDPVRKAANYYIKHFDDLTRFVDHAEVPLDNNEAEREFQRHAKLRDACLFAGSPEGAHRWATLFGVVRTAQKCNVDVFAYLTWVFERRGSHRKRFAMPAAELTPMAFRALGCPGAVRAAA
jgi:transposase